MRILLTVHQFMPRHNTGTEVATRDSGLELLRRGHDVHVLTTEPELSSTASSLTRRDYEYRGLKVHALSIPKRGSAAERLTSEYQNPRVADYVRGYVERLAPDVIHMFHLGWFSGSVVDAFRDQKVPLVFTATDFWSICVRSILAKPSGELCGGPDELSSNCLECRNADRWFGNRAGMRNHRDPKRFRRLAERGVAARPGEHRNMPLVRSTLERTEYLRGQINSVDAILAPTRLMADMLTSNGIDEEKVTVSPYGLDVSAFRDAKRARAASDEVRFGFIGTIRQPKGVGILVSAFERLPVDAAASLRIVGELGSVPDLGRHVYREASRDPRINFTGLIPNEEIGTQLEKIDVLVVPSTWYENSPITIFSAAAAGIPSIASDLGGMSEVVTHDVDGLLFAPGDPQALAEQMRRVIDEPDLLARLKANVAEARSAEDAVDELERLYAELGADLARPLQPVIAATGGDSAAQSAGARTTHAAPCLEHASLIEPPIRMPRPTLRPEPIVAEAGAVRGPSRPADRPLFFVTGRAKSGTTWLARLLNAHPEILCKGEGRFFGRDFRMGDSGVTSLYGALVDSEHLRRWVETSAWTRRRDTEEGVQAITAAVVRQLMERDLQKSGKRMVGDKTPLAGPEMLEEIAWLQPEARVVHVVRDGRDVAISSIHHVWNQSQGEGGVHLLSPEQTAKREAYRADPSGFIARGESLFTEGWLEGTAREWKALVQGARERGAAALGERYLQLSYEEMLADPEYELARILEFLEASTNPDTISRCVELASFERFADGRPRGVEQSSHFMRKGVAGNWREVFTTRDRSDFKRAAGDLLIDLGYERDNDW